LNSAKNLADTMGPMTLSEYVKIVDLTLLSFMNKLEYSSSKLEVVEEFIKGYIHDCCKCVDCQEQQGMKLIKVHLLVHFVECIQMYGSPMNFNGATGESHLKAKTKQPVCRTRMCYKDMEYRTAMKDYKNIVLERGLAEIERTHDPILEKIWRTILVNGTSHSRMKMERFDCARSME